MNGTWVVGLQYYLRVEKNDLIEHKIRIEYEFDIDLKFRITMTLEITSEKYDVSPTIF